MFVRRRSAGRSCDLRRVDAECVRNGAMSWAEHLRLVTLGHDLVVDSPVRCVCCSSLVMRQEDCRCRFFGVLTLSVCLLRCCSDWSPDGALLCALHGNRVIVQWWGASSLMSLSGIFGACPIPGGYWNSLHSHGKMLPATVHTLRRSGATKQQTVCLFVALGNGSWTLCHNTPSLAPGLAELDRGLLSRGVPLFSPSPAYGMR